MNKSTEKNKEPDLSGLAELKKNFAELKEKIGSRKKEPRGEGHLVERTFGIEDSDLKEVVKIVDHPS